MKMNVPNMSKTQRELMKKIGCEERDFARMMQIM